MPLPETHGARDEANVAKFVEVMDSITATLSQEVVDDPEDLFEPLAELAVLWNRGVRARLKRGT